MIFAETFLEFLNKKINFFTGVPDSVLKALTLNLENLSKKKHIIATNEGSAVSLAIGYYLSTKKLAAVYFQNSGLGNAINPLISIANKEVYSIPMLLIIGWRGAPSQKDEPQHNAKGKITLKLLDILKIKNCEIRNSNDLNKLSKLLSYSKKNKVPVACLFKKNIIFTKKKFKFKKNKNSLIRNQVIKELLIKLKKNTKIIATTGYTSRELFQIRKQNKIKGSKDFYMVGGMGHASMVSLALAIHSKNEILCLDGDGSVLMHLGALGISGHLGTKNFKHIIFNNFAHESVGGQATIANKLNFRKLSESFGYKKFYSADNSFTFKKNLKNFLKCNGPALFEIKIKKSAMENLSRPKDFIKIKKYFLK